MHFMKQRNDAYNMTKYIANQQKQQRMPSEVSHHHPLARTVSTPMPIPDANQDVSNLFSSLNDILNAGATVVGTGHRKLERTQSEPLPQTNTSRWVEFTIDIEWFFLLRSYILHVLCSLFIRFILTATRQNCVVPSKKLASASMAINVSLLMECTNCATCSVTQNIKLSCVAHFIALAFVHMERGKK